MIASSPCRSSRIEASVVTVFVGMVLGGCLLAVRVTRVVVVVAAVGGSLGTSLTTAAALRLVVLAVVGSVLMAVLTANLYPVGGSRLIPKKNEQMIMIG
jgi:hypothetical protein